MKIKNIAFNEVIHSGNDLGDHIKMAMEDNRDLEIFLEKIMSASHFWTIPIISPVHSFVIEAMAAFTPLWTNMCGEKFKNIDFKGDNMALAIF